MMRSIGCRQVGLLAAVLFGSASLGAATPHETVGLWVFDGESGVTVDNGTVFENQIAAHPELKMGVDFQKLSGATWATWKYSQTARYTNDLPIAESTYLFSDCAMTNAPIALSSSIHVGSVRVLPAYIDPSSSDADGYSTANCAGNRLYVPGAGACLTNEDGSLMDFTMEILVRFDVGALSQYGNIIGLTARTNDLAHSPALALIAAQNGDVTGLALSHIDGSFDYNKRYAVASYQFYSRKRPFCGEWRHLAIRYDATTGQASLSCNYWDDGWGNNNAVTIPLDDVNCAINSVDGTEELQVFGINPRFWQTYPHKGGNVAAVRLSRGLLRADELMNVHRHDLSDATKEPMTISHWRFGAEAGEVMSNVVDAVTGLDANLMHSPWSPSHLGVGAYNNQFVYAAEFPKNFVQVDGVRIPSGTVLTSTQPNGAQTNLMARIYDTPAYLARSFTIEQWVRRDSAAYAGQGAVMRAATPIFATDRFAYSINCQETAGSTPYLNVTYYQGGSAKYNYMGNFNRYDEWIHHAVVFDAATRKLTVYLHDASNREILKNTIEIPEDAVFWMTAANQWLPVVNPYVPYSGSMRGAVDELRITRGVLTPDQFIKAYRTDGTGGMMLLFR